MLRGTAEQVAMPGLLSSQVPLAASQAAFADAGSTEKSKPAAPVGGVAWVSFGAGAGSGESGAAAVESGAGACAGAVGVVLVGAGVAEAIDATSSSRQATSESVLVRVEPELLLPPEELGT